MLKYILGHIFGYLMFVERKLKIIVAIQNNFGNMFFMVRE